MFTALYPKFRWLFLLLLMAGAGTTAYGQDNLPALVKKVEPCIVVIVTFDARGKPVGIGSGFFISKEGDVITNYHVLEGASEAMVRTSGGKAYAVKKVLGEEKEADLVRLSVDISPEGVSVLEIARSLPEVGEHIAVIGTPMGLEKTVSDGIVAAIREVPEFGKVIQVTAPISTGSSGSPVVNMRGEVIGVATFFMTQGQNLNFAIPSEKITRLKQGAAKTLAERAERAVEQSVASAEKLYQTGLRYLWIEAYAEALPYFEEAIKTNRLYAEAYFQVGYCMGKLGRYPEAIDRYKEALRIKPQDAEVLNNLCVAHAMTGGYTEAVEACKQAVALKGDLAEAYSNLGWSYHRMGRFQEAIESCKQAIRIEPGLVKAHFNLGNNYFALRSYQEAEESFKQAIRLKFDFAEAHLNLGAVYFQTGRFQEAMDSYRQAIRIRPRFPEAYLDLGMVHLKMGDRGSALEAYQALKDMDKNLANQLFNVIYE